MADCPFRLDSPRSFPEWHQLGLAKDVEQDSLGSSEYDSDDVAAAAETQLLNDSLELMAQTAPAAFAEEEDFLELVAQQRDTPEDAACESYFVVANALAGTHVRRPRFSTEADDFFERLSETQQTLSST